MNRRLLMLCALACACACTVLSGAAAAQSLADPTRPPPESRLLPSSAQDAPVATSGPQLQSVLIGSRGREVAVIDGQTVRKGEKFHGAVLIEVGKNRVVLQNGRHKQILTLFPDAKKAAH